MKHAPTHIDDDTEAARLLVAALNSGDCDGWSLGPARAIGRHDLLGLWSLHTPDGPRYRVATVRVVDGKPVGFDEVYRDETDAVAVWEHLAAEARAQRR